MNVLIYCDWFEQYTSELVSALVQQQPGTSVGTVSLVVRETSPEFRGQGRIGDGIRIRDQMQSLTNLRVLPGTYRGLRSLARLQQILRETTPDVIHVQQTGDPRFLWAVCRHRTVLTLHEPRPRAGHERKATFRQFSSNAIQLLYRRLCGLIIVHTESALDGLTPQERRKAVVIPHGVRAHPSPPNMESKTILFFGRADGYKGLGTLVDAMHLVWRAEPTACLRILASGGPRELRLTDRRISATWSGFTDDELRGALRDARAVCLPYTTASGSGAASLTHGAGKPLVASNIDGLRQLVTQPDLLVKPGDADDLARALIHVLRNQYEVQPIRQERTWDSVAHEHLRAYRRLLLRRRNAAE